ncbi:MAG: response regulator [Terriglobales bacterium]
MSLRGTILVVDDDTALLTCLELVLKLAGFRTITTTTGQSALEKLAQGDVDVIVLDCCLPDTDGAKLVTTIKDKWPLVRVILSSGYLQDEDTPGVDAVLTKPFAPQDLVSMIGRLLPGAVAGTGT